MVRKLVVATGNPGKLKEIQEYLTDLPWELELKPAEVYRRRRNRNYFYC